MIKRLITISLLCASTVFFQSSYSAQSQKSSRAKPITSQVQKAIANAHNFDHLAFNRIATELNIPLFWQLTKEEKDVFEPQNLHYIWGVSKDKADDWIHNGSFTPKFARALENIIDVFEHGHADTDATPQEQQRRALVRKELSLGMPTLIHSNFKNMSGKEQRMVKHVLKAARWIETIYAKQNGSFEFRSALSQLDPSSQYLFYRNQGPWCEAPGVSNDPRCNALPDAPDKISGLYPASLQITLDFCAQLAKMEDSNQFLNPFTAVISTKNGLQPSPYNQVYATEIAHISDHLLQAADALEGSTELALQTYLRAAASSFVSNDWQAADEAWANMNANNSKWYLRIAPDEVYFEPCSRKAGFHVSFATINQDSKYWQEKLEPLKANMELRLAELAGAPYQAREVSFHLPDFIDIVLNAGNARSAVGATIGQSLPNWGPVANEGRGRTVAMTNLYTDPDSRRNELMQSKSLLCPDSMKDYTQNSTPKTMSVVLHEAAHNLGPAHEYRVDGQTASEIFGGPLASMLEELKAQSAALYFTDWLLEKGVIDEALAHQAHTADITWAFGHIAQGMYGSRGESKAYSQLAAVQLGYLIENHAITWNPDSLAANQSDLGCFSINQKELPDAILRLMKNVAQIKSQGDKSAAQILKERYVDQKGKTQQRMKTIATRWLRSPKSSFIYSIDLD